MCAVRSLLWGIGEAKSEEENETLASTVVGLGSNRGPAESETQREPRAPTIRIARRQKIQRVVVASLIYQVSYDTSMYKNLNSGRLISRTLR